MSKEDLKVKPAEQEVKEEDLKEVNGGGILCIQNYEDPRMFE